MRAGEISQAKAPPRLTTSWDDGYPADLRLGELLSRHGIPGVFYVPTRNSEGLPVLSPKEITELGRSHQLGGHSVNHVVLTGLPSDALAREIADNKAYLEDHSYGPVTDFAYVRGRHNRAVRRAVQAAGYVSARTVTNLCTAGGRSDPLQTPTSLQYFPHARDIYVRNFLRHGWSSNRAANLGIACGVADLERRVEQMALSAQRSGGSFHLWGHSWELDQYGLWDRLDRSLARLRAIFAGE